jgi:hypothetical protein
MSRSFNEPLPQAAIARRTLVAALGAGPIATSFATTAFETKDPPMTGNTDAQIHHIYDRWHETIVQRDVDGLMELYAENAIFETPAILVTLTDRTEAFFEGKK